MIKGRFLYHITAIKNLEKIMAEGIKPDKDGHVFALITDARKVLREVSLDQVFEKRIAVIKIDMAKMKRAGIRFALSDDKVAEFTAGLHRIICTQAKIPPAFLKRHALMRFYAHSLETWVKIMKRRGVEISPEVEKEVRAERNRKYRHKRYCQ